MDNDMGWMIIGSAETNKFCWQHVDGQGYPRYEYAQRETERINDAIDKVEQLQADLDKIQQLFSEMIDTAKTHGNRINMENSAYADLYKLLDMSEHRRTLTQTAEKEQHHGTRRL